MFGEEAEAVSIFPRAAAHNHSLVPAAIHGTYGSLDPERAGEPCMTPYGVVMVLYLKIQSLV